MLAEERLLPQQEHLSLFLDFAFVRERDEKVADDWLGFDTQFLAAEHGIVVLLF